MIIVLLATFLLLVFHETASTQLTAAPCTSVEFATVRDTTFYETVCVGTARPDYVIPSGSDSVLRDGMTVTPPAPHPATHPPHGY